MGYFQALADALINGTFRAILSDKLIGGERVVLNSTMQWSDTLSSDVTSHAVEQGAPITDNIFNNPQIINITCIIADNIGLATIPTRTNTRSVEERLFLLKKWRLQKKTLFFIFDGETYPDMVLMEMTRDKEPSLRKGARLTLSLKEIKIATSIGGSKGKTDKIALLESLFKTIA